MALSPFFSSRRSNSGTIFDPFSWDPYFPSSSSALFNWPFRLLDSESSRQLAHEASAVANTQVDWKETPEAHIFQADLSGVKKEEIKVQVEDGRVLCISSEGSRKEEKRQGDKWHRVEPAHGSFLRHFRLLDNAKAQAMSARVENGVLTIAVPKRQTQKANKLAITDVPISC